MSTDDERFDAAPEPGRVVPVYAVTGGRTRSDAASGTGPSASARGGGAGYPPGGQKISSGRPSGSLNDSPDP